MNTPTPQAPLEYAGFWIRLWASFIDSILVAVIIWPIVSAVYDVETTDLPIGDTGSLLLESFKPQGTLDFLLSWVFPAVAVIVFWIYRAATPGKMLVRAKIVDANTGAPPSTGQCIGRYLGYYVSIFTFFLGFLWIAFDPRKQGFHDKLAGTVVVRTRKRTFTPTQPG
jgi:uncharacterized RDD family membrane protein YckC